MATVYAYEGEGGVDHGIGRGYAGVAVAESPEVDERGYGGVECAMAQFVDLF